jgi:hypothetical protein
MPALYVLDRRFVYWFIGLLVYWFISLLVYCTFMGQNDIGF